MISSSPVKAPVVFIVVKSSMEYSMLAHVVHVVSIVNVLERIVKFHRKTVYIVTIVVVLLSIYGVSQITTTGNIIDDLPKNDPIVEDLLFFEKSFNGVMPFEIVIDTKKKNGVFAENGKALYKIQKLQRVMANHSEFSKPLSITGITEKKGVW